MSSSISAASCCVVRAWSESTQNWITANATPIPDTEPNWVSYKLYESLNGTVPLPTFQSINNVTQKVRPTGKFDWCKQKTSRKHQDVVFQIRSKHETLPCDMGVQQSVLLPMEPQTLKEAPVLQRNADEEDTDGPSRNTEKLIKEPLNSE
jgi:hypothetical protein